MNLLLLTPAQLGPNNTAVATARQSEHAQTVLGATPGDTLCVGLLNGMTGHARVDGFYNNRLHLGELHLDTPPPPQLPLTLVLGLPRPRMLQRLLQTTATLGVMQLHLLQTARVEKSFWQTPLLKDAAVTDQLYLGLEQGKATQPPAVHYHRRFVPFIEDTLPHLLSQATRALIAHPQPATPAPAAEAGTTVLAIGPEGGFLAQEVARFTELGFRTMSLGPRILKVETAVPVAIAKLF